MTHRPVLAGATSPERAPIAETFFFPYQNVVSTGFDNF